MISLFFTRHVGSVSSRQWLPFALCFLHAYGAADVIAGLRKRLVLPGGLAWIWWEVRTNFTKPAKVTRRLERLRTEIRRLGLHRPAPVERARNKRRPSIICQTTRPGMPRASSRILAIKDRAKAAFPGMPSRLPGSNGPTRQELQHECRRRNRSDPARCTAKCE